MKLNVIMLTETSHDEDKILGNNKLWIKCLKVSQMVIQFSVINSLGMKHGPCQLQIYTIN